MKIELINYTLLTLPQQEELLNIRNLNYIRVEMKDSSIISLADHLAWIEKLKLDTLNVYYAVISNENIIGAIYLTQINLQKSISKWGIFFKNEINPLLSSLSLYKFLELIFDKYPIKRLELEVDKNNTKAYKFDKSFGFKEYNNSVDINNEYIEMYLSEDMWNVQKEKPMFKLLKNKLEKIEFCIKDS